VGMFSNLNKGALHRDFGIPEDEKIPKTLRDRAARVHIPKGAKGKRIKNPTKKGKETIFVTPKVKRRAQFAKTLGEFRQ